MDGRSRCERFLRYSLAIAILIALGALGYWHGNDAGYELTEPPPSSNAIYRVIYPVDDLVKPLPSFTGAPVAAPGAPNFDPLVDLIIATVEHESWMENGTGEGEINIFPTNLALVISQTERVHRQIADLLEQLRRLNEDIQAKDVVPYLQSCAANGRDASHVFRKLPSGAEGAASARGFFYSLVENLASLWGPPTLNGDHAGKNFPSWSKSQRIALWPRGAGQAYVAIAQGDDGCTSLVAGWHRGD